MSIFTDKTAIVTGAASGIGKALAEALARQGAIVVAGDKNAAGVEAMAKAASQAGGKIKAVGLDVTDAAAVQRVVDETAREHGRLDYIFNNAGIGVGGEARDISLADWRAVLDVNLMGVVHGVAAAYPRMVKQGFGHIVNTASIEGLVPFPITIAYAASKYAVVGISSSLRVEGADLGVKVSALCPGFIRTPIFTDSKMVGLDRTKMHLDLGEKIGVSPERCAAVALRGVERNRAIITVTAHAKLFWWLHRLSPNLVIALMKWAMRRIREEARVEGQ